MSAVEETGHKTPQSDDHISDTYIPIPHAIHRNFIADQGMETPKQVARSLAKYGKKHPGLEMNAFIIPRFRAH